MRQASGTKALARVRQMRRDATPAEARLWQALRAGRLGAKFRRQVWVDAFIADFMCREAMLIVEVDGGQHGGPRDERRDMVLAGLGFRVVRVWNSDVMDNLDGVLARIAGCLPSPSHRPAAGGPLPLPMGEGI